MNCKEEEGRHVKMSKNTLIKELNAQKYLVCMHARIIN